MGLVRWFGDLDRHGLALAGGKGANLGEMTRAGLPVPPGFVLLTAAYRGFVGANGLQPEIERLAAQGESASPAIRALFEHREIPAEVASAVIDAYRRLGGGVVAVRSSATAEDLPGASFAGQQETYLNIEGEPAVLEAVRRCWSSLWTPRAISYRARQGIAPGDLSLAVVIQRQVHADAAGVLFTVNPVTGHRLQMVIDGAWGLGEAVVSGQVTPDHWVVRAADGAVVEAELSRKAVMTIRVPGGTELAPVPQERQAVACLTEPQVTELTALGRRVAEYYGEPQDIEWALAGGQFYLVQSRPVTTLFPLPQPAPPPEAGLRLYFSVNYIQGFTEPFTPMGIDFFKQFAAGVGRFWGHQIKPGVPAPATAEAHLRIYVDVTRALRHPRTHKLIQIPPKIIDRQMATALEGLVARERRLDPVPGPLPLKPKPAMVPFVLGRVLQVAFAPDSARRRVLAELESYACALEERARRLTGVEARLQFLYAEVEGMFRNLAGMGALMFPAIGLRFLLEHKLQQWLGDSSGLQPVLRSLPFNPTTEMDLALWHLSRELEGEPTADHPKVRAFLAKYGHRGVREIDLGMPRWREEPEHVLNVLRTYLAQGAEADAEAHFAAGAAAAEQGGAALVARVRREKGALRGAFTRFAVRRIRQLAGLREVPKFYFVRAIDIFRQVIRGAGEELVAAGRLDDAGDVFYLRMKHLTDPTADLRALAAEARAQYRRELGRRVVPRLMTSEGVTFYGAAAAVKGALPGLATSPGVYEGRVRVVFDPTTATLEPGEVLVAPGTDPAWTPLFLAAGALVMEVGGVMSHGSVVAREYGIPAVVAVAGATERLKTGQRVRVDGESGQVIPLDE
ncbi:MAG TPA: PEP/pyruvate-binding domain-containing protein [Symbiobacteriaceae bacterium]|nr:PEP/pyruvate-binding domain-containing protein [Symbiobacteriaceae bacterium]